MPVEEKQWHLLENWTKLINHNVPIADNRKDIKYYKEEFEDVDYFFYRKQRPFINIMTWDTKETYRI
ncbi:MAG: hypothetical protein Q8835_03095 [Sweet potato little leaf phytoplasma]|nr:hypothetical protein [Sweet potato little leaf phytoplasma]